jgi:hypothetical protein
MRAFSYHFTKQHHFGLEAAIFYWHFVDVVWLFLFVAVYYWGGLLLRLQPFYRGFYFFFINSFLFDGLYFFLLALKWIFLLNLFLKHVTFSCYMPLQQHHGS